jgi:NAD(P)H dehydrogenase (quinone)
MRVLIVHAHAEAKSFNAALTEQAIATLTSEGHEVRVSDLYQMRFDPISDRRNFTTVRDADFLKQQWEEDYATEHDGFTPELQAEIEKVEWCDVLIFQFPLWWFGLPAILKGWVDRVFAFKRVYGRGRLYENAAFAGKRALVSLTTGGIGTMYTATGLHGEMEKVLFPIHHGMLAFTGFTVLPPFLSYAVAHGSEADRAEQLRAWDARLRALETTEPLQWAPRFAEIDEAGQDRLPRFLVQGTFTAEPTGIERLKAQGIVQAAQLSEDRRQGWLTVRAADAEAARESVRTLPFLTEPCPVAVRMV